MIYYYCITRHQGIVIFVLTGEEDNFEPTKYINSL